MRWSNMKSQVAITHCLVIAVAFLAVCTTAEDGSTVSAGSQTGRSIGSAPSNVVKVQLYYESLCYDSIQFVKNQLARTIQQLGDYFVVEYIPYGKASHQRITDQNGNEKWHFTCQHGPAECYGNKAQACAIEDILSNPDRPNKQQDLANFVTCVMSARNPSNAVPPCLETIGVDASHRSLVNQCIASSQGDDLLAANGEKTFAVQPNIVFVPTIVLDGEFTQDNQSSALRDFKGTICQQIPIQSRPALCGV